MLTPERVNEIKSKLRKVYDPVEVEQIILENNLGYIRECIKGDGMSVSPFKTQGNYAVAIAIRMPQWTVTRVLIVGCPIEFGDDGAEFMAKYCYGATELASVITGYELRMEAKINQKHSYGAN